MLIKFFSSYRPVLPNFRSLFYSTELAEIVDGEGQICKPKRIKVILLDAFSKNPLSLAESPWRRERGGVRASRKGPKTVDEHFANGSVSFLPPSTSPSSPVSYFLPSFFHPYLGGSDGSPPMSLSLSLSFFYIRGVNTFLERPVRNLFSFNL